MFLIFRTGRSVRLARYRYNPELRRSVREHVITLPRDVVELPDAAQAWSVVERQHFELEVLTPNRTAARAVSKLPALLEAARTEVASGEVDQDESTRLLAAAQSLVEALGTRGPR